MELVYKRAVFASLFHGVVKKTDSSVEHKCFTFLVSIPPKQRGELGARIPIYHQYGPTFSLTYGSLESLKNVFHMWWVMVFIICGIIFCGKKKKAQLSSFA